MRPYLNNYFETLSGRRQERVSSLLEEARVGKEQLDELANRLHSTITGEGFSPVALGKDQADSLIRSDNTSLNIRDITLRIRDLYRISNLISLLLNSHASVLVADVKALEDELIAMEKLAFNFAFLLSDNQSFDYGYLESFSDERGRDGRFSVVPDRSGSPFGPAAHAAVRVDEGVLSLPQSLANSHGLSGEILKGNATAFAVSDTGLKNVFSKGTSTGWKMTLATAGPITAPLPEANGRTGAQVMLEFRLSQPAPCSEIKLVPFADMPIEVLQVTTYNGEDDSTGKNLLDSPRIMDRPLTLHFVMESVVRFRVLLNQPTYERVTKFEKVAEHRYMELVREINNQRTIGVKRHSRKGVNHLERAEQARIMGKTYYSSSLPSTDLSPTYGPMNTKQLAKILRYKLSSRWQKVVGKKSYIVYDVVKLSGHMKEVTRNSADPTFNKLTHYLTTDNPIHQVIERPPLTGFTEAGFDYHYNVGLHYVGIGTEAPGFKGVFVSKPLPSPGDIGEVRIKTEEDNYIVPVSSRNSKIVTSVEYSVSNKSNPIEENDWLPILPAGQHKVEGERLFFDEAGQAYLRFPAQSSQLLSIYRNGYLISLDSSAFIRGTPGSFIGLRLKGSFTPDDIFTCDYFPVGDPSVINFQAYGFDLPPLVSVHSTDGTGEKFLSTGERNTVNLSYFPYIDPAQAAAGGYQPIVVKFDDGTVAQNLTDYQTNKTVPLPPSDYYYIHSGDTLMFNQPIKKPFRVYYQYLQNNVRVRTILRCNAKDFVSPKVDYVHVKAKTRRPDARRL